MGPAAAGVPRWAMQKVPAQGHHPDVRSHTPQEHLPSQMEPKSTVVREGKQGPAWSRFHTATVPIIQPQITHHTDIPLSLKTRGHILHACAQRLFVRMAVSGGTSVDKRDHVYIREG